MTLRRFYCCAVDGEMVRHPMGEYYLIEDLPPPTILEPICEAYKEFSRVLALPENKQDESLPPVFEVVEAAGQKLIKAVFDTIRKEALTNYNEFFLD